MTATTTSLGGMSAQGQHLTQRDRILARLQRGPATNSDFIAMGIYRYGARLLELRDAGHRIECRAVKGKPGLNRYELVTA